MEIIPIASHYLFEVNSYLLKTGEECFLIDTGMAKKQAQLEKKLQDAGVRPGDLRLIIITHGHFDHIGNAAHLKETFGAKVAMHSGDLGMVESGDMFVDTRGGVMVGVVGFFMKVFGLSGYGRFAPDMLIEDNQDLSALGLEATIVHVPGHSGGSIGVLTVGGDFFCGDLLVNMDKPARNTLIDDPVKYKESVERLKTLKIKTVYPGHGKPFLFERLEGAN
jgi:hydroxyacylglutathione hydrolase